MATSAPEPDPSALESLDDLLSKSRVQSSSQQHNGGQDAIASASSSAVTITSPKQPPVRDETRWNGFHLWRTESQVLRATEERAAAESRELEHRQNWITSIGQLARGWYEGGGGAAAEFPSEEQRSEDKMTWVHMLLLTVVSAGGQLIWCLGFGYGTPYLLSIGMTKSSTSLVWLSLPVTGIVMQPLVGVLSDLSTSRFRRRQYIALGLAILIPSTLILAASTDISSVLVDIFRTGLADWDPTRQEAVEDIDKIVAVISIVFMYLSINTIQPASRALILDAAPLSQHSRANAWSGRMTHLGNVGGYAAGMVDLSSYKAVSWVGGGQFRKCAVLSVAGATICSLITCFFIKEDSREDFEGSAADGFVNKIKEALFHIWQTIRRLPRPVRRICLVQVFAFMAWFPFLVYATEWVIELQQGESNKVSDGEINDKDAERGSFALLMFAIVALISGTILPYFTLSYAADTGKSIHLPGPEGESMLPDDDIRAVPLVKPRPKSWKLTLRTIWTLSLSLYCIQAVVLTFVVRTTNQAIGLLASIGIPWAVAQWVPFALVMESVREAEAGLSPFEFEGDWFAPERVRGRRESSSAFARARVQEAVTDCEPLSTSSATDSSKKQLQQSRQPSTFLARGTEIARESLQGSPSRQPSMGVPVPVVNTSVEEMSLGGTVLGIHNMAIVLPQLIFALVAAIVLEKGPTVSDSQGAAVSRGVSVVWVIRLGGLASLFAAILTRFVPLTRIERQRRGIGLFGPEPRYDDEVTEDEEEPEEADARS